MVWHHNNITHQSIKLANFVFGQNITNVALVIADPLSKKNLGRGSPFNVSYQHCCKKKTINVNDSQNLAFATSHFVIELLPFEYLSNQKQWKSTKKKCISRGITLHTVVAHFQLWEIFCRSGHAEHFCSLNFPSISNSFWDIRWKY